MGQHHTTHQHTVPQYTALTKLFHTVHKTLLRHTILTLTRSLCAANSFFNDVFTVYSSSGVGVTLKETGIALPEDKDVLFDQVSIIEEYSEC